MIEFEWKIVYIAVLVVFTSFVFLEVKNIIPYLLNYGMVINSAPDRRWGIDDRVSLGAISGNAGSVVFLKTHKTGSSTVVGILWRLLCITEQKNCFVPPYDNPGRTFDPSKSLHFQYMSDKTIYTASQSVASKTINAKNAPFEVWLSHVKFHPNLWKIMKKPIVPVTIVRHPGYRFHSAWYWYELYKDILVNTNTTLDDVVTEVTTFFSSHSSTVLSLQPSTSQLPLYLNIIKQHRKDYPILYDIYFLYPHGNGRHRSGLDSMSQELVGLSLLSSYFNDEFSYLLQDIQNQNIFVMVLERFEESLLVLHHLLYPTEEFFISNHMHRYLYMKQKVQSYHLLSNISLRADEFQALYDIQAYDKHLYESANRFLTIWIQQLYPDAVFRASVIDSMKTVNRRIDEFCSVDKSDNKIKATGHSNYEEPLQTISIYLEETKETISLTVDCNLLRRDNREAVQAFYLSAT